MAKISFARWFCKKIVNIPEAILLALKEVIQELNDYPETEMFLGVFIAGFSLAVILPISWAFDFGLVFVWLPIFFLLIALHGYYRYDTKGDC